MLSLLSMRHSGERFKMAKAVIKKEIFSYEEAQSYWEKIRWNIENS